MNLPWHFGQLNDTAELLTEEQDQFTCKELRLAHAEIYGYEEPLSFQKIYNWVRHARRHRKLHPVNENAKPYEVRFFTYNDVLIDPRTDEEVLAVGDRRETWEGLGEEYIPPNNRHDGGKDLRFVATKYDPVTAQKTYVAICRYRDRYGVPWHGQDLKLDN